MGDDDQALHCSCAHGYCIGQRESFEAEHRLEESSISFITKVFRSPRYAAPIFSVGFWVTVRVIN